MPIFYLKKSFSFESAHFLPHVPDGHKCKNVHGHSFACEIQIKGGLDPKMGWVMDYADLKKAYEPLRKILDHKLLNDLEGLENPTSEILCQWIGERLKKELPLLHSVTIRETCTSECTMEF